MTEPTCRADYYGEQSCVLPPGHPSPVDGAEAHQGPDGFRWFHFIDLVGYDGEDEVWDEWDEPVEDEGV